MTETGTFRAHLRVGLSIVRSKVDKLLVPYLDTVARENVYLVVDFIREKSAKLASAISFGVVLLVFNESVSERVGCSIVEVASLVLAVRKLDRQNYFEIIGLAKLVVFYGIICICGNDLVKMLALAAGIHTTTATSVYGSYLEGRFYSTRAFNKKPRRRERIIKPVDQDSLLPYRQDAFRGSSEFDD